MDSKTYEYMNERVSKYRNISQEIAKLKVVAATCNNPDGNIPQLYLGGTYHELPSAILVAIKAYIETVISQKEAELERI